MPGGPSTSPAPLTVAVDATSLLGRPTGIGVFTAGLLAGLAGRSDVEPSAFAVSWRRREGIEALLPRGVPARQRAMPARPLHLAWRHCELPPVEWFIGPTDVVHGPNFVVPPTRKAARVMSVQDLTPVRFPELCDPATLVFPSLVARALDHGAFVHASTRFIADEVLEYFRCHRAGRRGQPRAAVAARGHEHRGGHGPLSRGCRALCARRRHRGAEEGSPWPGPGLRRKWRPRRPTSPSCWPASAAGEPTRSTGRSPPRPTPRASC